MAPIRNVAILVIVAVAMLLQCSEAEDYTVGGGVIGWTSFPPGGASFYSKWAANLTFKVNDNLVFNFETGSHSVAILTKVNYDKCNVNDNIIQDFNKGPVKITLSRTGDFYFSCTFSRHCTSGQKLRVKVTLGSSSPIPGEGPSSPASGSVPTSSPTGPGGATAPPPHSSATAQAATTIFSLTTAFLTLGHAKVMHG